MADVFSSTFSETAASNNAAAPNGWPEGQAPSSVNDCARETHAAVKRLYDRDHATTAATIGGTANAITLAYPVAFTAYAQGQKFAFKATAANSGPVTVNVDTLGALSVKRRSLTGAAVALVGGEWQAGDVIELEYDGTQFQAIGIAPTRQMLLWSTSVALSPGTTTFTGPAGAASGEASVQVPVPFAGTVRNLQAFATTAPGVGKNFAATMRLQEVDTLLACTISGAGVTASDTTHSFAVTAGQFLDIKVATDAGAASSILTFGFEITTP